MVVPSATVVCGCRRCVMGAAPANHVIAGSGARDELPSTSLSRILARLYHISSFINILDKPSL